MNKKTLTFFISLFGVILFSNLIKADHAAALKQEIMVPKNVPIPTPPSLDDIKKSLGRTLPPTTTISSYEQERRRLREELIASITPTPTPTTLPLPAITIVPVPVPSAVVSDYPFRIVESCSEIGTREAANKYSNLLINNDLYPTNYLDIDQDRIVCEHLPRALPWAGLSSSLGVLFFYSFSNTKKINKFIQNFQTDKTIFIVHSYIAFMLGIFNAGLILPNILPLSSTVFYYVIISFFLTFIFEFLFITFYSKYKVVFIKH